MRLTNRAAERFQRALEGERVTDAELEGLLQTSRALSTVPLAGAAPREGFVLALRERLMAEAEQMPSPSPAAAKAAAGRRAAARSAPVVVVVGRGFPRVLAGAAASVVAVGAIVGVASRSAIPGSALYPVKGWLDSVAVQMAGSDYDRGLTHLSQAQEHISDARALAEQSNVDPQEFVDVLRSAVSSVRSGQRDLNTSFDATGNPQALLAIRDFSARALPQVEALQPEVPAKALPVLGELQALLADAESASLRRLAACAPTCARSTGASVSPTDLPTLPGAAPSGGATTSSASGSAGVQVPGTAVTVAPGGGAPGVTAGSGGLTLGGSSGGAMLSTGGTTLNGPSVGASVPGLPSLSVTLPSVGIATTSIGATLPGATLGTLPLPGVSVSVPLSPLP